ncbi:MAG: hypothetical protein KBS38_03685, partial [Bacteroidales bacterium]|nr:hypothetical protein [Candidatus Cacconaster caballi]
MNTRGCTNPAAPEGPQIRRRQEQKPAKAFFGDIKSVLSRTNYGETVLLKAETTQAVSDNFDSSAHTNELFAEWVDIAVRTASAADSKLFAEQMTQMA